MLAGFAAGSGSFNRVYCESQWTNQNGREGEGDKRGWELGSLRFIIDGRTRPDTRLSDASLGISVRAPSFVPPFHAPSSLLINSLYNPQPLVVSTIEKTRFRAFENKAGYTALGAPKHLYKRVNKKADRRTDG